MTTAKALAMELKLTEGAWQATYQSRFGPAEWLKPYTETALKECAVAGMGEVDVICPGFPADCLETLEEIGLRYAESFRAGGGKNLRYIPALNARADHVKALARERALQHPAQRRLVVDHEDGAGRGVHEAEARASGGVRNRWTTRASASLESRDRRISPAVSPR